MDTKARITGKATALLGAEEERRLARASQASDAEAFARLVEAHIPLVHAIAAEFRSFGLPLEDLIGEGLLGLVKAARSFDPARGVRLSGYAAWWIRAYVRRYTIENRRIVRAPSTRNARKVMAGLSRVERGLRQVHGDRLDSDLVARALGVRASDVEEVKAVLGGRDIAYGVRIGDAKPFEVASEQPTPEAAASEAAERRASSARVRRALSSLDPRARRILERRYLEPEASTFAQLGHELGISRERVRQIEVQAKARVRELLCA